jgi:hypothetical protein
LIHRRIGQEGGSGRHSDSLTKLSRGGRVGVA